MKFIFFFTTLSVLVILSQGSVPPSKKNLLPHQTSTRPSISAKIYSNFAEIIEPLSKLPLEFTKDEWIDIRPDSISLIGSNVTIIEQTMIEKKNSLNNVEMYVRSPVSSQTETKFVRATMIDEKRNLVKLIDKEISKDPVYFSVPSNDILYNEIPPQSKYYVNFTYDTTDAIYVSYLRSNLNWKTRYQLNLFEETKAPVLIGMADIRNDGQSKVDIEHGELLGGDINLQIGRSPQVYNAYRSVDNLEMYADETSSSSSKRRFKLESGEELAGLYAFTINQPFTIEAKTNYLLPMYRPRVTVDRYALILNTFSGSTSSTSGKGRRSYRLSADRFLTRGDCLIREFDRLVGETTIPDLAAKDKYEFSVGQDADITYKENVTLISTRTFNETYPGSGEVQVRTQSVYEINVVVKNYKRDRAVKVEYEQQVFGKIVKLVTSNTMFTQDGTNIKTAFTVGPNEEKTFSYKIDVTK